MSDQVGEGSARSSLEDLLKSMNKWPVKEASELELDPSGDPEPHALSELNESLQTLLSEAETGTDVGLTRRPACASTATTTDEQVNLQTLA